MNWLKQLSARQRRYDDLAATIREHFDEKIADFMERRMTRDEADKAFGSGIGLITALLTSRLLSSFLYGTSAHDPWIIVGSIAALFLVACTSSLIPAVRASRLHPMTALRIE